MRILILTSSPFAHPESQPSYRQESTYALYDAFQKAGHQVTLARYQDLEVRLQERVELLLAGEPVKEFSAILLRTVVEVEAKRNDSQLAALLAAYAKQEHILTLNAQHFFNFPHEFTKLFQMQFLVDHQFAIPTTYYSLQSTSQQSWPTPLVEKPLMGSHGNGVVLCEKFAATADAKKMYQEILPNRQDLRILVLGGHCLGAMRRRAKAGNFVSNYSAGGQVEPFALNTELRKLALRISRCFHFDFCGIDLMEDAEGRWRVLEVNRSPGFVGFMQATGIDVPAALMNYIQKQQKKELSVQ